MAKQNRNGTWVISPEQAREFLTQDINYDKLIADCLKRPEHKTLESLDRAKDQFDEIKRNQKKPSIWTKEFTFSLGK